MIPRFRSRAALWIIRLAILIPGVLTAGYPVFELGGCRIGLTHPGGCEAIPDWLGDIALLAALGGLTLAAYVAPVALALALLMEVLARRSDPPAT